MASYRDLTAAASDKSKLFNSIMEYFCADDAPQREERSVIILRRITEIYTGKIPPAFRQYLIHDIDETIGFLENDGLIEYDPNNGTLEPTRQAFFVYQDSIGAASLTDQADAETDEWEPLALDRNDESVKEAVKLTEELLERVRGDNGFSSSNPEKHAYIVWSLKAGLDAIKQRVPTREQVRNLLLKPMHWLGEHFSKAAIGELAKQATTALLRALGWPQ
jgi:hypothetical protein